MHLSTHDLALVLVTWPCWWQALLETADLSTHNRRVLRCIFKEFDPKEDGRMLTIGMFLQAAGDEWSRKFGQVILEFLGRPA